VVVNIELSDVVGESGNWAATNWAPFCVNVSLGAIEILTKGGDAVEVLLFSCRVKKSRIFGAYDAPLMTARCPSVG
jgi:hypothetical protein